MLEEIRGPVCVKKCKNLQKETDYVKKFSNIKIKMLKQISYFRHLDIFLQRKYLFLLVIFLMVRFGQSLDIQTADFKQYGELNGTFEIICLWALLQPHPDLKINLIVLRAIKRPP